METWILMADEGQASLVVRSAYGPCYEIESWKRRADSTQAFAGQIARRIQSLQGHFDQLVVAAAPSILDSLYSSLSHALRGKSVHRCARYLSPLSQRELKEELQALIPV